MTDGITTDIKRKNRIKILIETLVFFTILLVFVMVYKHDVKSTEKDLSNCLDRVEDYERGYFDKYKMVGESVEINFSKVLANSIEKEK